ncbi:hypothetical protein [Amycolatopsis speibonae]|uniref:Uncharacterized protein n=1 Tax=Amycolatopsis speibonae TaxID=1450224 RepID=A0ABV7P7F5_9PSEU
MAIDVGDRYRLSWTNTAPGSGGLVNADTVVLTITLPDGSTVAPGVTNPPSPTGKYVYDYQTVQSGRHSARWVGTGTGAGAHVEVFDVRPADVPYLVSLQDIKDQTNITNDVSDEELRTYLESATGVIERHLGQAVVKRTYSEEHQIGHGLLVLNWTPVIAVTALSLVDGTHTWNVNDLHVTPAGVVTTPHGVNPYGHVAAIYTAGMTIVPEEYGLAARIIVQHLWETQRGNAGGPRVGLPDSMMSNAGGYSGKGYAIPNRALELLGGGLPGIA